MTHTVLSLEERIENQSGLRANETQQAIAVRLSRSPSAIRAKLKRNASRDHYGAQSAHRAAHERMGRTRRGYCAIDQMPPLRDAGHAYLRRGWSPEEIAGTLKLDHLDTPHMHTSHESIYRDVYVVARGEL
ncbi:MAG: helix-turn-helix domain-containing protein [Candidatus Synoicihabitans palmerolidicus]|nr:helix-turn-helix domain-containing protein [Candidatus Synoicihabitans palmerolidicus]